MARRFTPRPRPAYAAPEAGYPSLAEHRATRRAFLTVVGAVLLGGALPRCRTSGAPGSPAYYQSFRLPLSGTLVAALREGGMCEFIVHFEAVAYEGVVQSPAEDAAEGVVASFSADELAADADLLDARQALAEALAPLVVEIGPLPALLIVELAGPAA